MEEYYRNSLSGNSGSLGISGNKPLRVKDLMKIFPNDDDSEDKEPNSEKSDEDSDDPDSVQPLPEDTENSESKKSGKNYSSVNSISDSISEVLPSFSNLVIAKESSLKTINKVNSIPEEDHSSFEKRTQEELIKYPKSFNIDGSPKEIILDNDVASLIIQTGTENKNCIRSQSTERIIDDDFSRKKEGKFNDNNFKIDQEKKFIENNFQRKQDNKDQEIGGLPAESHFDNKEQVNLRKSNDDTLEKILASKNKKIFSNDEKQVSSHLVTETPLKQTQIIGSTRPMPCFSQKSLFMTPQNKMESDYSKNCAPTPATILSHWTNSRLQTPLQNHVQRSGQISQSSSKLISQSNCMKQHEIPRYGIENRNVRRPLMETLKSNPIVKENIPPQSLDMRQNSTHYSKPEALSKPVVIENNPRSKRDFITNENNQSNAEIYIKSRVIPNKENVDNPRNLIVNINHQANRKKSVEIENIPKNYSSVTVNNEQPKILERVPISPAINVQNFQKDEFIKVKDRQYRNLGIVGRGMSGKVYKVQDLSSNELRAIKFVDLSTLDKESVNGCLEEIRMLCRLQATCIIRMFDYEVTEDHIYVVMELGDADLSSLIKTNSIEKDLYFTLYYWRQMLLAVNHIHKNGVIHSDLKPGNFVLVKGVLKLIDFGIASSLNADMTSVVKNSTTGTLSYISPEALTDIVDSPNQNAKHKINYKSDVWALGCILYSLVYGHTPFQDIRNQWHKINAIKNPKYKIPFPSCNGNKDQPIPAILIDVMKRCLNRDSRARPTVEQLLEVSYVSTKSSLNSPPCSDVPAQIMFKIKQNLSEEEWRQFIEIMEKKRQA